MLGLAGKLLGDDADADDLQGVLRALPHNVTTEMDLRLWQVATVIRRNVAEADLVWTTPAQELAAIFTRPARFHLVQRELAAFLDKYGHRAVARSTSVCRAGRRTRPTFPALANYLRLDDPKRAPDAMFTTGAAEADALVATLTARARQRGRLRGLIVDSRSTAPVSLPACASPSHYFIVASLRRSLRLSAPNSPPGA